MSVALYVSPGAASPVKMYLPCRPPLQRLSQFLRNFCWRIGEVADQLQISTCEQEYEDDVDEEEQEVSEEVKSVRLCSCLVPS